MEFIDNDSVEVLKKMRVLDPNRDHRFDRFRRREEDLGSVVKHSPSRWLSNIAVPKPDPHSEKTRVTLECQSALEWVP